MIESIVSNGSSGPAKAALDVAIKLGLDYFGWCRKGDHLPAKYPLERVTGVSASHQAVDERAVGAADGSLCFSETIRASLRLETLKKIVLRLNKPFLLIALEQESGFSASRSIAAWIADNRIRKLHVDGEDETADGSVGERVSKILEAAFFLAMMDTGLTLPLKSVLSNERSTTGSPSPQNIEAALNHLENTLSLKDRAVIANMTADELVSLHFSLGAYINNHFDLFTTNTSLLKECQYRSGNMELAPTDAAAVIIRSLWERLRANTRIRIVK